MDGKPQIKKIPEVDIPKWMKSLDDKLTSVSMEEHGGPRGQRAILFSILRHPKDPLKRNHYSPILLIWGENRSDGVHLHFMSRPYSSDAPVLTMKFKGWRPERGMAAILSVLAYFVEKPRLTRKFRLADEWLRQMRNQIIKHFHKLARSFDDLGVEPNVIAAERMCFQLFKSLAGLDVKESLDRVKKEYKLLTQYMSEDDMLRIWRESIVESVVTS